MVRWLKVLLGSVVTVGGGVGLDFVEVFHGVFLGWLSLAVIHDSRSG